MAHVTPNGRARVLDAGGRELSPCPAERALKLVATGRAALASEEPLTIRLPYAVTLPPTHEPQRKAPVTPGTPLLLHICCGPCATYPVPHLREMGFDVWGYWYNPNIQPGEEHARREQSAYLYAGRVGLPLASRPYEPERYALAVRGHEERPARCRACYRLRLEEAALEAQRRGIESFTTTLLISPYQDQAALREIGEEAAAHYGRRFIFENLRRGWAERSRLAREYGLYLQQYCGCLFSLAERRRAQAAQRALVPEERT